MKKLITTLSILLIATTAHAQTPAPSEKTPDASKTGYTVERVIGGSNERA